jgi:hypothetical protein
VLRASIMAIHESQLHNTGTLGLSKSPAWDDWFDPGDPQWRDPSQAADSVEQQAVISRTPRHRRSRSRDNSASLPVLDGTPVKPSSAGGDGVHAIGGDTTTVRSGCGHPSRRKGSRPPSVEASTQPACSIARAGCTPGLSSSCFHTTLMLFMETAAAPRALNVACSRPAAAF